DERRCTAGRPFTTSLRQTTSWGYGSRICASLVRDDTEGVAPKCRYDDAKALRLLHHRLQIIIRLDDLDQAIFGRAVAAIGVGMVLLDQRLVLRLDLFQSRAGGKPHYLQRLALGVHHLARLGLGLLGA